MRSLTLSLILVLMPFVPLGVANADDDATARAKNEAARHAAEAAEMRRLIAQMAADRQKMKTALNDLQKRVRLLTNELMETKDRLRQVERKLADAANTHAAPAQPTVESSGNGSHPAKLVGAYNLDKEHLRKAMLEIGLEKVESMIDQVPEESRAGVIEMLKSQIDLQVERFHITLKLASNGTFTAKGRTGSEVVDASGTWSASGTSITLTTTIESGATLSDPETQRATLDGDALLVTLEESEDFAVRMVKQ